MAAVPDTRVKTHLSLHVRDVERSRAFYETFFGVPAHKVRPGYVNFDLAEPALKLALLEAPQLVGKGTLNHLGIQARTPSEVRATKERLEKSGLITFSEEDTTCCFARQDKVWVQDPDGNAWEVYVLVDDMQDDYDEREHPTGGSRCCTPETSGPVCCTTTEMNLSLPPTLANEQGCCS